MENVVDYVHHETVQTAQPVTKIQPKPAEPAVAETTEVPDEATLRDTIRTHLVAYINQFGSDTPKHLYKEMLKLIEKPMLVGIMKYTRNNQSRAAKLLNISRGTLRKKLKTYGLL